MPTSGDTWLRLIRRTSTPPIDNPKVIGVDDWAQRRGHVYGTLIVDLERHRAIDLLANRTIETLADWLLQHPTVKIIARDRSGEYARGSELGAPGAQQIADRWHLLVNLREAFERLLDRLRPELGPYLSTEPLKEQAGIRVFRARHRSQTQAAARQGRRSRRVAQHEKVHRLYQADYAIRAIARRLKMSRTTVYRYLSTATLALPVARRHPPSQLDPCVPYLSQRWQAGCRNAFLLWREIRQQGYPRTGKQITQWAYERRERPAPTTPVKCLEHRPPSNGAQLPVVAAVDRPALPTAHRLVWLFLKHSDQLALDELKLRDRLLSHPVLTKAQKLAQDFHRALQFPKPQRFDTWLKACETVNIPEVVNLAVGMRRTYSAVKAAFRSMYSNGQTEGQVNLLKLLKRQMYGRANLDLLRSRFLAPT